MIDFCNYKWTTAMEGGLQLQEQNEDGLNEARQWIDTEGGAE